MGEELGGMLCVHIDKMNSAVGRSGEPRHSSRTLSIGGSAGVRGVGVCTGRAISLMLDATKRTSLKGVAKNVLRRRFAVGGKVI